MEKLKHMCINITLITIFYFQGAPACMHQSTSTILKIDVKLKSRLMSIKPKSKSSQQINKVSRKCRRCQKCRLMNLCQKSKLLNYCQSCQHENLVKILLKNYSKVNENSILEVIHLVEFIHFHDRFLEKRCLFIILELKCIDQYQVSLPASCVLCTPHRVNIYSAVGSSSCSGLGSWGYWREWQWSTLDASITRFELILCVLCLAGTVHYGQILLECRALAINGMSPQHVNHEDMHCNAKTTCYQQCCLWNHFYNCSSSHVHGTHVHTHVQCTPDNASDISNE